MVSMLNPGLLGHLTDIYSFR